MAMTLPETKSRPLILRTSAFSRYAPPVLSFVCRTKHFPANGELSGLADSSALPPRRNITRRAKRANMASGIERGDFIGRSFVNKRGSVERPHYSGLAAVGVIRRAAGRGLIVGSETCHACHAVLAFLSHRR